MSHLPVREQVLVIDLNATLPKEAQLTSGATGIVERFFSSFDGAGMERFGHHP